MSPVTVFFRTLLKSSAMFVGAAAIFLHPSLDWRSGATAERTSGCRNAIVWSSLSRVINPAWIAGSSVSSVASCP